MSAFVAKSPAPLSVRRSAVPKVLVSLNFDAGFAADTLDTPGTQSLMMGMLDEGTTTRTATQIAEEQERLGATISSGASLDSSSVTLDALTANLAPSLALMAGLPWPTWERLLIWMGIGVVIYAVYGRRHSKLAQLADATVPPAVPEITR